MVDRRVVPSEITGAVSTEQAALLSILNVHLQQRLPQGLPLGLSHRMRRRSLSQPIADAV